jgi:hypothetical protein
LSRACSNVACGGMLGPVRTSSTVGRSAAGAGQEGTGWSYASAGAAAIVTDVLAGVVVGRRIADIPAAAEAMARALRNIGRAGPGRWPAR